MWQVQTVLLEEQCYIPSVFSRLILKFTKKYTLSSLIVRYVLVDQTNDS